MRTTLVLLVAAALAGAFQRNDSLAGMADTSFRDLGYRLISQQWRGQGEILAYSGMAYDGLRHKIAAFGGGHATEWYPNEAVEFDFETLQWSQITPRDTCADYDSAHAVRDSLGRNLGGVRYPDHIAPASRHTYDGLVIPPDTSVLIVIQATEFKGGCMSAENFDAYYKGGSGLWTLDMAARKWSVREEAGLSTCYALSAQDPAAPDWVYMASAYTCENFHKMNWRTGEKVNLARKPADGADMSMEFFPDSGTILLFDEGGNVHSYGATANAWTTLNPAGVRPSCYSLNVVYDTLNHVFAVFSNNRFNYYSPATNTWYALPDSIPMTRLMHHHVYDPVDNVHIMVGSDWHTYVYKFSDTPGKFPGTSQGSSTELSKSMPGQGLSAFPNPFSGTVRLHLPAGASEIRIFDLRGRQTADLSGRIRANQVSWNAEKLTPGVYFCRVKIGEQESVGRLLLVK